MIPMKWKCSLRPSASCHLNMQQFDSSGAMAAWVKISLWSPSLQTSDTPCALQNASYHLF